MVVQDDYITIKAYKPPPQQVVSGKKRWHEALAEAAQHQPRGSGYLNDEQRECMMRCMAASRRTFRDVAMSVYGGVFSDVAQFLDGGRRRRSVWQRAREKLASSSVANAAGKAKVYRQPHSFSSAFQQETLFDRNHTGDTSTLLPCAVIYPNMHPTDRPELLKFLLSAVQQHQAEQPLARGGGLPLLGCTIRSTRHTTLASILRDLYLQIMAAVASMPVKARGQRKGAQRFRVAAAPQGTLGEVILAYRMLVDELLTLQQSSSSGAGVGARAGGTAAAAAPVGVKPCPSLLLMFEDVEALNNRLLEDLLRLLAEASESLPARLVFLVSPAFSLAQNLGNGATATLEPSTFILPPAHVCFEKVRDWCSRKYWCLGCDSAHRHVNLDFTHYSHSLTLSSTPPPSPPPLSPSLPHSALLAAPAPLSGRESACDGLRSGPPVFPGHVFGSAFEHHHIYPTS